MQNKYKKVTLYLLHNAIIARKTDETCSTGNHFLVHQATILMLSHKHEKQKGA